MRTNHFVLTPSRGFDRRHPGRSLDRRQHSGCLPSRPSNPAVTTFDFPQHACATRNQWITSQCSQPHLSDLDWLAFDECQQNWTYLFVNKTAQLSGDVKTARRSIRSQFQAPPTGGPAGPATAPEDASSHPFGKGIMPRPIGHRWSLQMQGERQFSASHRGPRRITLRPPMVRRLASDCQTTRVPANGRSPARTVHTFDFDGADVRPHAPVRQITHEADADRH
jgi:hypothetical protein